MSLLEPNYKVVAFGVFVYSLLMNVDYAVTVGFGYS